MDELKKQKLAAAFPTMKIDWEIPNCVDVDLLIKKISDSKWLLSRVRFMPLSIVLSIYDKIICGFYDTYINASTTRL